VGWGDFGFWLRCSSVTEPGLCSFVAPRQKPKLPPAKPQVIFEQTIKFSLLFCAAGALVLDSAPPAGAAEVKPIAVTGTIPWVYSYAEGQQLARETGKPMLVVFRCER